MSCVQGYDDALDATLSRNDKVSFQEAMRACMDGDESCSDTLVILHVSGEGVPTHQKMFWTSRTVYMEVCLLVGCGNGDPACYNNVL